MHLYMPQCKGLGGLGVSCHAISLELKIDDVQDFRHTEPFAGLWDR